MKRAGVLLAAALLIGGCSNSPSTHQEPIERGWIERSVLQKPEHRIFAANYDSAQVDGRLIDMIRQVDRDIDMVVVLGTWCSDSRREVPRFLKVIDAAGIPGARVKLYAVDRSKKGDDGVPQGYGIELVPTFIFLKGGKEIGRIVETPRTSIEGDMLAILAGAP